MDKRQSLYLDRWKQALENHIAERGEPRGSGYYSLRHPNKLRRQDGSEYTPSIAHAHIWMVLCNSAHDLTRSVTHTWQGKEMLMQKASTTEFILDSTIDDLIDMGFVRRRRRGPNRTLELELHLVPLAPGEENDVVDPVSIAPEDMGFYICKAAIAKGESNAALEHYFPEHSSLKTSTKRIALTRSAAEWSKAAGSGRDCYAALKTILTDESEGGFSTFSNLATSTSLGAYITAAFPSWLAKYNATIKDAEVIASI
jgi:hypothetical protein